MPDRWACSVDRDSFAHTPGVGSRTSSPTSCVLCAVFAVPAGPPTLSVAAGPLRRVVISTSPWSLRFVQAGDPTLTEAPGCSGITVRNAWLRSTPTPPWGGAPSSPPGPRLVACHRGVGCPSVARGACVHAGDQRSARTRAEGLRAPESKRRSDERGRAGDGSWRQYRRDPDG